MTEGIEDVRGPCETCRHWTRLEVLGGPKWAPSGRCAFMKETIRTLEGHRCEKWRPCDKNRMEVMARYKKDGIEEIDGPCASCRHWRREESNSIWGKCALFVVCKRPFIQNYVLTETSFTSRDTHHCAKWEPREENDFE